ncbi:MAG: regulatory protein RecX [Lentisphaeria bacterium]|nr:regulatory protein RecX [Lentisphaeria bacterium]
MNDRENSAAREKCRERALKLLTQKPHTVKQLRDKLIKKEFPLPHVTEIIDDFVRVGLLNDRQVASDYCGYMKQASPPVGRSRVKNKLYQYGVPPDVINEVLAERWDADGDEGELSRAVEAVRRKARLIKNQPDPQKTRATLYRFLANKGFSSSACSQAVAQWMASKKEI